MSGDGQCPRCGQVISRLHDQFLDLLGRGSDFSGRILDWPDAFVDRLKEWMLALAAGAALPADAAKELAHAGLSDAAGRLTAQGRVVAHLFQREASHEDEFHAFLPRSGLRPGAAVLEVGCSASPYLRALWRSHAIRGYGLDLDLEALALGCRLAEREKMDLSFCRASAHDLPYGDAAFDFVICRNALTYMAQRTAVGEMMRVVKPGGFIYLRFENIWYDLLHTTHPHGWRQLCCRLRDFGFGLVNAASGWQPVPGAAGCSIGRSFATVGRLTKLLCRGGGQLVEVRPSLKCPTFLGRSTQTSLLARRAAR